MINGWLEGKYTGTRYVHANGEVIAKVKYSEKERIYFKQKEKKLTGKKEQKRAIIINKIIINFNKSLSKFEKYDTILTEKKLKLSSNYYLPISILKKENYEKNEEEKVYEIDEAKNKGIQIIKERLKNIKKEDIINEQIITNECKDYIDIELIYEVLENIGTEEKIAL